MIQPIDQSFLVDVCNLFGLEFNEVTEVATTEQGTVIKGKRGFEVRVPSKGKHLPPSPTPPSPYIFPTVSDVIQPGRITWQGPPTTINTGDVLTDTSRATVSTS